MLNINRIISLMIFLLLSIFLSAEAPTFNLHTETVMEYPPGGNYSSFWFYDGKVYLCFNSQTYRLDPADKSVYIYDKNTELSNIHGEKDGRFIVSRIKSDELKWYFDEDGYVDLYLFDPVKNSYEELGNIIGGSIYTYFRHLYSLYEDLYMGSRRRREASDMWVSVDVSTGKEIIRDSESGFFGVSPDKIHGIIAERGIGLKVINLKTRETIGVINRHSSLGEIYFVSTNLIASAGSGSMHIYNISGSEVAIFNYLEPKDIANYSITSFLKVKNSEYGIGRFSIENVNHFLLLKTPNEMEYLDDLGLLFNPTTGTANDSRVRIREWPLLDAKHMDYLTKGDKLEILDRSGIKVKIGEMEDYWYKLRRVSDRIEGWSYGAFIDLDVE